MFFLCNGRSANAEPNDTYKQMLYFQALNSNGLYSQVVSRFETTGYAKDEACAREYVLALNELNNLPRASFTRMASVLVNGEQPYQQQQSQTQSQSQSFSPREFLRLQAIGDHMNPLPITFTKKLRKL